LQSGSAHQQRHRFRTDRKAVPERQLGMYASIPIHATEVSVHLADEIGEPRVPYRP
jgi:hypothetical protein